MSPQELTPLRLALDDAVDSRRARIRGAANDGRISQDYERVFDQYVNLWTDYPAARRIAFDPRLAESARRLTGCRHVRIYHDHAMIKPPGERSKPTNWHQDAPYWAMDPVGALSAWIAVDDVNIDNGCLHFVPGSHRHGRRESIKLDVAGDSIVDMMREQGYEVPVENRWPWRWPPARPARCGQAAPGTIHCIRFWPASRWQDRSSAMRLVRSSPNNRRDHILAP